MSDARAAGSPSDLCLACGLCCNSGLFTHVELTNDDRELLAANGLAAPERIEQPCAFWNGCCSIYSARPGKCREYRCELLRRLEANEIRFGEARERVATALEMRGRFVGLLPDSRRFTESARSWRDSPKERRSAAMSQAMLDFVVFRMFVEKHFLGPEQRWVTNPVPGNSRPPA